MINLQKLILELYNVDISKDPSNFPKNMHARCYTRISAKRVQPGEKLASFQTEGIEEELEQLSVVAQGGSRFINSLRSTTTGENREKS